VADEKPDALAVVPPAPLAAALDGHRQRGAQHAARARSKSTLRAYKGDWERFQAWCRDHGTPSLPAAPIDICAYLTWLSEPTPGVVGHKIATVQRAYAAIRVAHEAAGAPIGTLRPVSDAMRSIARRLAELRVYRVQKKALEVHEVIAAAAKLPDTLEGARDRVVLLFGSAIGQRRADIARVRVEDIEIIPEGFKVTIRMSKTDQTGKGHTVAVIRAKDPRGCPVVAVEAWRRRAEIEDGFLVRRLHRTAGVTRSGVTGATIAAIVKKAAESLGLDPALYGGHSLRRGLVSSAARAGRDLDEIMSTTGHESVEQVRTYIDSSTMVQRAAGRGLFDVSPATEINAAEMPAEVIEHPTTGQPLTKKRKRN